ncbi:MAG: DUF5689 domain-containing protein [Gelidibacter sp.]
MKANKILILLSVVAMTFGMTSCVEDDDFKTPDVSVVDPNINPNDIIQFNAVVARYNDAVADGQSVGTFEFDQDPIYIEGYVVSSDQSGNFFEELIIQNKTDDSDPSENPRLGFNVMINARALYETYEIGRKVYVKLNGLGIGESNGVLVIGKAVGNTIEQIQESEFRNYVIRGAEVATITPKVALIGDLTEADENTFVQFNDVQIDRNQLSLTYAGEATDEFDGFRTLLSCEDGATISLQTSTFADFKSLPIPQGKGNIKGIFTRDFGDDFNVLVINSRGDVDMNNPERCDPAILDCTGATSTTDVLFSQNFEGTSESALTAAGWINVNTNGGSFKYSLRTFSGNSYMQVSAFNSNENPYEAWLITPAVNLDASTLEQLTFKTNAGYYNGAALNVYVSTDFTGNVADIDDATWMLVDATLPTGPSSGYGTTFTNSGVVNISCLEGNVYVGFNYVGSSTGITTTFQVDDVTITGTL